MHATLSSSQQASIPRIELNQATDFRFFTLAYQGVMSFDLLPEECIHLVARSGHGWVTLEGDTQDHVLAPEAPLHFQGPGRLVIEALEKDGLCFSVQVALSIPIHGS